jgi:hypothetical protein
MIVLLAIATGASAALGYVALLALIKALPIVPNQMITFSVILAEFIECALAVAVIVGVVAFLARRLYRVQTWGAAVFAACGAVAVHAALMSEPWLGLPVWPLGMPQLAAGVALAAGMAWALRPLGSNYAFKPTV